MSVLQVPSTVHNHRTNFTCNIHIQLLAIYDLQKSLKKDKVFLYKYLPFQVNNLTTTIMSAISAEATLKANTEANATVSNTKIILKKVFLIWRYTGRC